MLVVFSFCHKDAELAAKQARWVKTLGGVGKHDAMIVCNKQVRTRKLEKPVLDDLSSVFNFVDVYTPHDEIEDGWPQSPNHMWVRTVQHVMNAKGNQPFLWMEADAVPICSSWLDDIEREFASCGKPFMGTEVSLPNIPVHMSGIAVYYRTPFVAPIFACVGNTAWDVALSPVILPHFHRTKRIQHDWKPDSFKTMEDLKRINQETVIYHQCKDGSLIDLLEQTRGGVKVAHAELIAPEVAGATPAPETFPQEVTELQAEIKRLTGEIEKMAAYARHDIASDPMANARAAKAKKAERSRKMKEAWKRRKEKAMA